MDSRGLVVVGGLLLLALMMRYDLGLTSLEQTSQLGAVRTRTFSLLSGLAVNVGK